jgi:hypothetical protein
MPIRPHFTRFRPKVKPPEILILQHVQRECVVQFRLAARAGNCRCTRGLRRWHWLGLCDFLMEEVLVLTEHEKGS